MKFGLFIDEIWVIYRRNLGQNSRWNINLLLKINFSRWIKNWEQSGRWIAILPLESHLDRRINTGVIWAVRSRCIKEGKYHQKITDISPIYHRFFATRGDFLKKSPIYLPEPIYRRYFGDIYGNISSPIFLHKISCRLLSIHDISAIYPDIFLHGYTSPHPMHMAPLLPVSIPIFKPTSLSKAPFIPINPFRFSDTYCHFISLYTTPHAHHHLFSLYTTCPSKPIFFTH